MKFEQMTSKSKEESAAFMLKVSYGLVMAFILTVTIAPMGTILANVAAGDAGSTGWLAICNAIVSWQGLIFILLEALVAWFSLDIRNRAFEIYNELYPDNDSGQAENPSEQNQGSQPQLTQAQ